MEHKALVVKQTAVQALQVSQANSTNNLLTAVAINRGGTEQDCKEALRMYTRVQVGLTVESAIAGTQLSALKKASKPEACEAIALALVGLSNFFNVGKNFNESQIMITTELILEKYWSFKLEEVLYVLKRAMSGVYGKVYDRIDGAMVLDWFNTYDITERADFIERKRLKEASERNKKIPDNADMQVLYKESKQAVNTSENDTKTQSDKDSEYNNWKIKYQSQNKK